LIWGSTYLAILWAMKTLPPFLMAGARFLAAGAVLFLWGKLRGAPWPRAVEWRSTLVIGAFLMLVGNGGVVYAESRLPTGLAALLIATVPLWMVVLEALRPGGKKPNARTLAGVAIGLVGVGILMARGSHTVESAIDPIGVASCLAAALCWSLGSIYSRRAPLPQSPPLTVGMEMLCGGTLLMLSAASTARSGRSISPRSRRAPGRRSPTLGSWDRWSDSRLHLPAARDHAGRGDDVRLRQSGGCRAARLGLRRREHHRADDRGDGGHRRRGGVDHAAERTATRPADRSRRARRRSS
jgi:hypothetical protein